VEQRVSLITLGVDDLERSVAFYQALGWSGQVVQDTAFFQAGGLAIVLWSRDALADDAGIDDDGGRFGGIALAQNVRTRDEVDEVLGAAEAAGGTITHPAADTFYGGYAGYVADPDGHLWEIAHNPGFTLLDDGSLVLPDLTAEG
jgi:predicted lactoylglutathione lyase